MLIGLTYALDMINIYELELVDTTNYWLGMIKTILFSCLLFMIVFKASMIIYKLYQAKSLKKFYLEDKYSKKVELGLLNSMKVNKSQEAISKIVVPDVDIKVNDFDVTVTIEKLSGMYENDIDQLSEVVNSSFTGKLNNYAVTSRSISSSGLYYVFRLQDIESDKTFKPKSIDDLKVSSHELILQNDLKINLADRPHLAIWGGTGSGKTTVLFSIISQLLSATTDIWFLDGKNEFSAFNVFYPSEKIVSENDDILLVLKMLSETIKERQQKVADEVKQQKKQGLRAYDLGLQPIVVIADEVGSIVASMNSKDKKEFNSLITQIVQKGRSVSVFLIISTQHAGVDVLPSGIRGQFATKILLGSANGDLQRMAFDGQTATKGDVDDFTGYYISNGLTNQPMKFYVPNLHENELNTLDVFEELYLENFKGSEE